MSPFMVVGTGITMSLLSVFIVIHACHHLLLSIFHSCLLCVVKLFCITGLAFGIDSGVVLVGCVCVQWCPVVGMGGFHGHWLSFVGHCVLCTSLLPLWLWCCVGWLLLFLDGWDCLTGWCLCDVTSILSIPPLIPAGIQEFRGIPGIPEDSGRNHRNPTGIDIKSPSILRFYFRHLLE